MSLSNRTDIQGKDYLEGKDYLDDDDITQMFASSSSTSSEVDQVKTEQTTRTQDSMVRHLSEIADPEVQRGVSLHSTLAGFGRHWVNRSGMFRVDDTSYLLSEPTRAYDVFLSHDWGSSGRFKVLTLLMIFNSQAAFFASLAVSAMVGVLRALGILPDEMWTVIFGHATFFVVLLFWQSLRLPCLRKLLVFMDRLCIDQNDAQLKQRGILSLPGFLLSSEKLVILWSEHYFSRLWCMFEMATFLKDPAGHKRVQIVPVKTGALVFLSSACWYVLCVAYNVIALHYDEVHGALDVETEVARVFLPAGIMIAIASFVVPVVYYLGIGLMSDVEQMPQQLASFTIKDASCACCDYQHKHPLTKTEMPCDRTSIFQMLSGWYADSAKAVGTDWIHEVDTVIRGRIGAIMSDVRQRTLPISYTIYMVGASNVPFLANFISAFIGRILQGPIGYCAFYTWALREFIGWAFVIVISIFTTRVSFSLWKHGLALQKRNYVCFRQRACMVALLVPCGCLVASFTWMSYILAYKGSTDASLLPILPFALTLAATMGLFFPRVCRRGSCMGLRGSLQKPPESPLAPTSVFHAEEMWTNEHTFAVAAELPEIFGRQLSSFSV